MKKPLIIIGAGALEVTKLVHAINRAEPEWELIGYVDDSSDKWGRELDGVPILGAVEQVLAPEYRDAALINAIGSPIARGRIAAELSVERERFVTLAHPGVDLWGVELGVGSVIHEGAILPHGGTLGDHLLISYHVVVAHDVVLGDYTNAAPGVGIMGRCVVGEGVFIGPGATLIPDVSVGPGATIGAGAVVIQPVAANTTVVGVPARVIKTGDEQP